MKINFAITPREGAPVLKLPADFKEQWVKALRSGKYQQTKQYLHTDEGFCCLGVACDMQVHNLWEQDGMRNLVTRVYATEYGSSSMPSREDYPADVWEALRQPTDADDIYPEFDFDSDLVDVGDGFSAPSVMAALAGINDAGDGYNTFSFADIADWIEANL